MPGFPFAFVSTSIRFVLLPNDRNFSYGDDSFYEAHRGRVDRWISWMDYLDRRGKEKYF